MSDLLYQAAKENDVESIIKLAKSGDDVNAYQSWIWSYFWADTPLSIAATNGHTEAVSTLLSLGAAVNLKTGSLFGWSTPISKVVNIIVEKMNANQKIVDASNSTDIQEKHHFSEAIENQYAVLQLLIDNGAKVESIPESFSSNGRGKSLTTLLTVAEGFNDIATIQKILDLNKVDPSTGLGKYNINLESLLTNACDTKETDTAIVKLLVEKGAYIYEPGLLSKCVDNGSYSKAQVLMDKMLDEGLIDYKSIKNMIPKINLDNVTFQLQHDGLVEHKGKLEKTISLVVAQQQNPISWLTQEYIKAKDALQVFEDNILKPFVKFTATLENELHVNLFDSKHVIYIEDVIDVSPAVNHTIADINVLSTQDVLQHKQAMNQLQCMNPPLMMAHALEHHEPVALI